MSNVRTALAPRATGNTSQASMKLLQPMLATLVQEPFDRDGWVYEEKYDGDRAMAYRERGAVRLISRNLKDHTREFPHIARTLETLSGGDFIVDGEIAVFDAHDVSRFQLLQRRAIDEGTTPVFAVFDCLEHDGECLVTAPLGRRRDALEELIPDRTRVIMRSRRLRTDGLSAYRTAQAKGWEGIVAKDDGAPYEPGRRSRSWLKVKCRRQSEFVIGGFTAPRGGRAHFGALLVGLYDGDRLRFVGKVGTGFSQATLTALGRRMERLRANAPPFEPPPREPNATWVRPGLVAEVTFVEWTRDGKLRQPVYLGLRHDKKAAECMWHERER